MHKKELSPATHDTSAHITIIVDFIYEYIENRIDRLRASSPINRSNRELNATMLRGLTGGSGQAEASAARLVRAARRVVRAALLKQVQAPAPAERRTRAGVLLKQCEKQS